MDVDEAMRRYTDAERNVHRAKRTIRKNQAIMGQVAKEILDHLMKGIVPHYGSGARGSWTIGKGKRCESLIGTSQQGLYRILDQCQDIAAGFGYARQLLAEADRTRDGREIIRITSEAIYGSRESDSKSVEIPVEYLRMEPDEFHVMVEEAIAKAEGERAERRRREAEVRRRRNGA